MGPLSTLVWTGDTPSEARASQSGVVNRCDPSGKHATTRNPFNLRQYDAVNQAGSTNVADVSVGLDE